MERSEMPVWCDGRLFAPDEAKVSVFDHGLTVGDGIFETLKVVDGVPFAPTRHLRRLRRSAEGLGLQLGLDDDELRGAMAQVLTSCRWPLARLRLTVTGGPAPLGSGRGRDEPTVVVAAAPLEPPPQSTAAVTVPWRRNELGATTGLKTTSYAENVIALAEATRRDASEALLANTAGDLCEGTGSNVFVVLDGQVLTPPTSSGCLAGITRELLLEQLGDVVEATVPFDRLADADEVFLTSSTRDVQAVDRLDGRSLGARGPQTTRAADAFGRLVTTDLDP